MKNIANADRPKSVGAMLPPRPFRRSGKVAQTACNSDRREGKSCIPTLNQTFADSRILKISKFRTFRIADHHPPVCSGCGEALTPDPSADYAARQVFDLPEPQPLIVTEHRAFSCRCEACGARTRAAFPAKVRVPAQYGARIAAFVVYLLHYQPLPEDRLVELMADLFGVKIAAGTIAAMSRNCAGRLHGFVEALRDFIAKAPVKHMDETGFRIAGKTQWLHVASTALLTFYRTCAKRGEMLADVIGVVVHDHWKPYYTMQGGVLHALCNAHHLRKTRSRAPPARMVASGAAESPAAPDTISCCACKPARRTRCVSSMIPPCPSATTRPNATGA